MMCLSWKMEQIEVNDSPSAAKPSTFLYVAKGLSFPFSRLSEWEQIIVIEARKHAFEEGKNCDLPRNESSPIKKEIQASVSQKLTSQGEFFIVNNS